MREEILTLFHKKNEWTLKELESSLHLKSSKDFVSLVKTLNALEEERILLNNHNSYLYTDTEKYLIGKVKDVSKFELLVSNKDQKVYLYKGKSCPYFDGDIVLVDLEKSEIVHLYEHGITSITGTFYHRKKGMIFHTDIDYHRTIQILNMSEFAIKNGHKAVVQIVKYGNTLQVRITKMLGHEKDPGVDITSMLHANHIRTEWPEAVNKEIAKIPNQVEAKDQLNRKDLRDLFTVTIDGDDAKDFDDAISIEKKKSGYTLYVHIADVSYYVKEQSAIDKEAYARSTSIYVCDRVVPMLPFAMSNGICSLNPNVDRCTITCKMEINSRGRCTSYEVFPSLIHSDKRCTYHQVNDVLEGKNVEGYENLTGFISTLRKCCEKLQKQDEKRGSIEFDTSESLIVLNKKGQAVDVQVKERGFAEQMIEECMILANVCVANLLHSHQYPCVYRIHEKPDPEKVSQICQAARTMDEVCAFYPEDVEPRDIQNFLQSISEEHHQVLSMISLRAMQKARYDAKCVGHFGLALKEYCHFTSPIRRYADLIVHRMLRKYIFQNQASTHIKKDQTKIETQAFHISLKEREAIAIERLVDDYKKAEYMKKHIGQHYVGSIVGVQSFGFFVELENTVEGLVPVHTLYDDFYQYDEVRMRLVAQSGHRFFELGQKVQVICTGVNLEKGQVEFAIWH